MRRATAATSRISNDLMSTPLDWRALGAQIRDVARQLASMHAATFVPQGRRSASECNVDADHSCGGDESE